MRARWLMFAFLVCGAVDAAEPTSTEDSLATAKRELEQLNAVKNAATALPDATLPRVTGGELQPVTEGLMLSKPATEKKRTPEKASANWLVDAMMKPDGKKAAGTSSDSLRGQDGVSSRSGKNDWASDLDPENPLTAARETGANEVKPDGTGKADAASEGNALRRPEAFDPFARYLAGWMTPEDYALLRRSDAGPRGTNAQEVTSALPGTSADLAATNAWRDLGLNGAPSRSEFVSAAPVENPYLQAMTAPEPAAPTFVPPPAPAPTAGVFAPLVAPPPAPAPLNSTIPDFVKPAADEKYFKPLKRF